MPIAPAPTMSILFGKPFHSSICLLWITLIFLLDFKESIVISSEPSARMHLFASINSPLVSNKTPESLKEIALATPLKITTPNLRSVFSMLLRRTWTILVLLSSTDCWAKLISEKPPFNMPLFESFFGTNEKDRLQGICLFWTSLYTFICIDIIKIVSITC